MLLALAGVAAAQDCPDRIGRLDLIDAAEQALLEADLGTADARLRELEKAFGCGSLAEPEILGRMWLVEGAYLALQGDPEAAEDSWRAAARVAPGVWVEDYGVRLRELYEDATAKPTATSSIVLDPPLFQYIGAVDGRVVSSFPHQVEAGLHLVQVGPNEDDVAFSRILLVFPDAQGVVVTGIQEVGGATPPDPEPDPDEDVPEPVEADEPLLTLHTGAGASISFGRAAAPAGAADEPQVQLTLPVETGLVVRPGGAWIRAAFAAAPMLGGSFVYSDDFGVARSPTLLGLHLAGGFAAEQGDMGVLVGQQWPGRWALRGVLAGRLPKLPLRFEGRVGLTLISQASPAPSLELLAAFVPRVVR